MCAADFMLSSFVLSFFSLGGSGGNISSVGVAMQSILCQLLHFSEPIPPVVCDHLGSLHLDQLSRLHQILASNLLLACACYSSEKY